MTESGHPAALGGIRTGASASIDPRRAARELANALAQPQMALVVVFVTEHYDFDALAGHLAESFGSVPVIGCTSAGNIGPLGYQAAGIAGFSLSSADFEVEHGLLENLTTTDKADARAFARRLNETLFDRLAETPTPNSFALMLVDGMSLREESLARAFYDGLGGIPLAGGSAGDNLRFKETRMFYAGRSLTNAAILAVVATRNPVIVFKTQHFSAEQTKMVVTGAQPEQRIVTEINGMPAAAEYARIIGLDPNKLDPFAFSSYPLVVRIGDSDFVRSIQKVNPDGSLSFFCAIDRGIVLRVARADDLQATLKQTLLYIRQQIGQPALIIGCDCILRLLECRSREMLQPVGELFAENNVIGFNTFGEQYRGMHINQTFTGIAIGERK